MTLCVPDLTFSELQTRGGVIQTHDLEYDKPPRTKKANGVICWGRDEPLIHDFAGELVRQKHTHPIASMWERDRSGPYGGAALCIPFPGRDDLCLKVIFDASMNGDLPLLHRFAKKSAFIVQICGHRYGDLPRVHNIHVAYDVEELIGRIQYSHGRARLPPFELDQVQSSE